MEIKNIIQKFKTAKIDKAGLVNNTVLFVLSYLGVFYLFQFFTIIPAFTEGVRMIIYNSYIDFNSVNTAATDKIWASPESVINIFGTSVIIEVVVILAAVLFLLKWDTERLNIRRLLFWVILCATIRLNGNFIYGHLFNLWNWNLVTDFLKITYPIMTLRYIIIILSFCIVFAVFRAMSYTIKKLFNPYAANRVNNLFSNVFFPVLFGSIFLLIWFIPHENKNETLSLALMFVATSFSLCRPFIKQYRGISNEVEATDDEKINKVPIIILLCLLPINILFAIGVFLETSPYRSFFVENAIMVSLVIVIILALVISIHIYKKRQKEAIIQYEKEKEEIDRISSKVESNQWGLDIPKDMDKYKKMWKDANDV